VAAGETVPPFCMGDPNAHVNIWQWKAAWQADIEQGFVDVEDAYPNTQVDLYPFEEEEIFNPARALGNVAAQVDRTTAVDNLLAGSFGTLTQAPDQGVQGWGEWRDGRWLVVFARDLQVNSDYTQFAEGDNTSVAFAVWDGAAGERDGMKSVSQFLTLDVSPEVAKVPGEGIPAWVIILVVVGGVALAIAGSVTYFARRRRA
ncbi:MAG: ethylbenzene dehydrogenase-related protein, partial [Dehalococcoidia bacterium]